MNLRLLIVTLFVTSIPLSVFGQVAGSRSEAVSFVNSPDINTPPGFTHSVVINSGKIVFVSGQVGVDKQGQMVGTDNFRAQTNQAFQNLKAVLAAAGAKPENVVKLMYYVVGLNHERLAALREIRNAFVGKVNPPTSTLVGVAALFREDALVEIEAVAVIPER
jgi:enamine deaminase RidA (YjgF/YER057c/UK114 family)